MGLSCVPLPPLVGELEALRPDPLSSRLADPGLPTHPSHALFKRFLPRGSGGMLCFALKPTSSLSSTAIARAFIDATQLAIHAPNVGDVRTLVLHPQSTTHRQLTPEEARENGSTPDLIRVSVGIEDVEDIMAGALASLSPSLSPSLSLSLCSAFGCVQGNGG